MRIFTLGRNGIPLFLFALILCSGTFSTYGQECPAVANSTQIFCDAEEAEISDLRVTGDDVVWYADAGLTEALPSTDLLQNAFTYYASDSEANCTAVAVTVQINLMPEILGVKEGSQVQVTALRQSLNTIGLCVADLNNPGVYVADLRTNINDANEIQWYFGNTEATAVKVGLGDELQNGTYWVERIVTTDNGTCTTNKRRTTVVLSSEEAPEGPANQVFCEIDNPTLADIDASGNNRYFASETSETRLSENTPLEDGATYWVSTFGELCESFERLAVTVTVNPLELIESPQSFCSSISEGNNIGVPTVANLEPAGGIWYSSTDFSQDPVDPTTELSKGDIYYLAPVEGECSTTQAIVEVMDSPNAGSTTSLTVCEAAEAFNLVDRINDSVLGAPDDTGTFSPALPGHSFDPAVFGPGTHTFTYTVEGTPNCPTDTSRITVVVQEGPNAGEDTALTFCEAELDALVAQVLEDPTQAQAIFVEMFGEDIQTDGTFSTSPLKIAGDYQLHKATGQLPNTYSTNYTVTDPVTGCVSTSALSLTVNPTPDAGTSTTIQLAEDSVEVIDLFAALGDPTPEGTWNNGDGTFDPSTDTPGVFTYTVTENGCSASASVTVVAPPQDCPVVTETTQELCESIGSGNDYDRPRVKNLKPADAVWYSSPDSQEPLDPTTFLTDDTVYYAGSASGDCADRPSVTFNLLPTPNAGSTTSIPFCSNDEPVNLVDFINPSQLGAPQQTGYFRPALEGNIFDPAAFEPGSHTFRYIVEGNEDCPTDESRITVVVSAAPNAGVDIAEEFCVADTSELPTAADFLAIYGDDDRDQTGTFSPTLQELAIAFAANPYGTFATTYTVTANNCTDTASLSVTITQEVPANAGGDVTETVCSTAGLLDLNDFLGEEAILGGFFSAPYENGTFDPSTAEGEVTITYTVNEEVACVTGEDSATITLTVIPGPDAGEDGSITLALTDAPVNLFDSLGGTPDEGGSWTPGNENGDLDPAEFVPGTYSYTYTVSSDNGCEDSAVVTVTITGEVTCPEVTLTEQSFCESVGTGNNFRLPNVSDLLPTGATWYASADATEALAADTPLVDGAVYYAGNSQGTCDARESVTVTLDDSPNAGSTTSITFCEGGEAVDLLPLINESILGAPDAGGTFSPALASGTTVFDPAVDVAGTYTYTVQSTNDVCPSDDSRITIIITPAETAGQDFTLNFCATDEPQDLFTLLPEGVSTNGTFEGIEDGIFDPAVDEAGEFTYTVEQTGECEGTSTATLTIIVSEVPEAPTAADQSFCTSEGATVADLVAEGDALLWYTDEALTTLADEADALVAGTYYVTNTVEGGCESAATAVVVTLSEAAAPTLAQNGNVFCEYNNPTIADLAANVSAAGTLAWYDAATGGNALTSSARLTHGTTYYVASTDATSACESARLPITVDLSDCPVVIPEAFSPNGDGVNDTFEITHIADEYPNYTIEIYNRWGNIVFKGNAATPNWDGVSTESRSIGNSVLPVGVYFYIVNYNDGQTAPTQGRVYLSR